MTLILALAQSQSGQPTAACLTREEVVQRQSVDGAVVGGIVAGSGCEFEIQRSVISREGTREQHFVANYPRGSAPAVVKWIRDTNENTSRASILTPSNTMQRSTAAYALNVTSQSDRIMGEDATNPVGSHPPTAGWFPVACIVAGAIVRGARFRRTVVQKGIPETRAVDLALVLLASGAVAAIPFFMSM